MMDSAFIAPLLFILALFILLETLMLWHRRRQKDEFRLLLHRAKKEVQEISQLPLNNPYPLIQIDESGDVIFANPAALENFSDLYTQGQNHKILRGALEVKTREIEYDDKIYHQTIKAARVNDEDVFTVYCFDISAQKLYERRLERAYKETQAARISAEQAKEARGAFLANMSHELRTPMNGIIGLSDILVEMRLEGEKQELMEAVNNSARNLLILLNDILDFSKIESGEFTVESIPFDIRKTVKQIESLQRSVASQKALILESRIAPNVPQILLGDPARLQQILNNLISNALKFTEEGSVVLAIDGDEGDAKEFTVRISVADTGVGIEKEKQKKIFEKFQQADTSTARKYGGTGLGLTITKNLVSLMGGKISVESDIGKGTTFTAEIKMKIAAAESAKEDTNNSAINPAGINTQAKLMIVDDHPVNLLFMRQSLKRLGFKNFAEASSGRQALDLFRQKQHDFILMDCHMPEMDGFEAARKIRKSENPNRKPVIVAVTADAMKGAYEKCMAAGMDDYISKPVDRAKLSRLIQKWLPGEGAAQTADDKAVGQMRSDNVVNISLLDDLTGGDVRVQKEMLRMFADTLEEDMDALKQSYQDKDYEKWDSCVHKIYGACSNVGAVVLAQICDRGQTLFPEKCNKIPACHAAIGSEYARVRRFLEKR